MIEKFDHAQERLLVASDFGKSVYVMRGKIVHSLFVYDLNLGNWESGIVRLNMCDGSGYGWWG